MISAIGKVKRPICVKLAGIKSTKSQRWLKE